MFKVINKKDDTIIVEMDLNTYAGIKEEVDEDIEGYEFIFEKPVEASKLINK